MSAFWVHRSNSPTKMINCTKNFGTVSLSVTRLPKTRSVQSYTTTNHSSVPIPSFWYRLMLLSLASFPLEQKPVLLAEWVLSAVMFYKCRWEAKLISVAFSLSRNFFTLQSKLHLCIEVSHFPNKLLVMKTLSPHKSMSPELDKAEKYVSSSGYILDLRHHGNTEIMREKKQNSGKVTSPLVILMRFLKTSSSIHVTKALFHWPHS